jgi:flagellar M-ring protein FliF
MSELWKNLRAMWTGLSRAARLVFVMVLAGLCVLAVWMFVWASNGNEQVLFSDLDARDAAAIVDELKRMKVPYQISDDGAKILVDAKVVHEVRLSLMGHGVPISGGVGFEIFDNKDVGMTESMQKINYQRALQGELARTIMANEQLKSARVHLVVDEGGLFNRDRTHPKAAVGVVLKPGAHLNNEQILGIQRLVAAAVPGLDASQVTVTDQRGIALSAESDEDGATGGGAPVAGKLRLKKQADDYLTRKVSEVLDRAFGPGQAIVSVDATLNFDEIHRTEQNVVPVHGHGDESGAVVRKRESTYRQPSAASAGKPLDVTSDRPAEPSGSLTSTSEVEYEFSKSGEQVLSTPGGIRRVSVGVIVPQSLTDDQLARVRDIVAMAVGFNSERGDAITVQPLSRLITRPAREVTPAAAAAVAPQAPAPEHAAPTPWRLEEHETELGVPGAALLIVVGMAVFLARRRAQRQALEGRLSAHERRQLLLEVASWIDAEKTTTGRVTPG